MRLVNSVLCIAVLGLAVNATAASAADMTRTDCDKARHASNDAMQANASSPNMDQAKGERDEAMGLCTNARYKQGVAHYNKATALLTGQQQASN